MISKQTIKDIVEEISSKKIGDDAILKINKILEDMVRKIIRKAARKADFSGRKVIKEEDIAYPKK